MKNKEKAMFEVLGYTGNEETAKKFFFNVYEFLLYNDTEGFLKTLEFRMGLGFGEKSNEEYLVFRFMLQHLLQEHPNRIAALHPELIHIPMSGAVKKANSDLPNTGASVISMTA